MKKMTVADVIDANQRDEDLSDEQWLRRNPHSQQPNEAALLRLLDAERARADVVENMAREANAECIKHWNRADAAEAKVAELECAPDCAERTGCTVIGGLGHFQCGYCQDHQKPRHHCGCIVAA
jgi:hypothetical protein